MTGESRATNRRKSGREVETLPKLASNVSDLSLAKPLNSESDMDPTTPFQVLIGQRANEHYLTSSEGNGVWAEGSNWGLKRPRQFGEKKFFFKDSL